MHWRKDKSERFRELAGQIATERDPDKFSALVKELKELIDGEQPLNESPKPESLG